ncbi:MAG: NRDE family protein [Oceanisphaera sp.]|uniref:NRDE family protein n=1 Tax=Oceanisphaera sp. TaxID=1929979 RepID=UPI003C726CFF
MCLIAFSWQPEYGCLHLLANRDEFYARPTAPAHWWPDDANIWAGRDLQAKGTWLGLTREGRFAALTNVRESAALSGGQSREKRSRGELVADFLRTQTGCEDYLQQVLSRGEEYPGFNLLLGDMNRGELWYVGNRSGAEARRLEAGLYGLSNAMLDTPWPKVERLKQGLAELGSVRDGTAFGLLDDGTRAALENLPNTGVGPKWESLLSSIFIQSADYGTRAQTVLCVEQGRVVVTEQGRGPQGAELERRQASWLLAEPKPEPELMSRHGNRV